MFQSIPRKPVFPALPPLSSRGSTHTAMAGWTALWESLVGKSRGKASRESHRSLDPRVGKRDTAATAREESAHTCPHSRRGLTPLGRLQKYPSSMSALQRKPQVPALTPHKVLGPGIDGRESREAPSNSHGEWPFLRPPERVVEVPVVSRQQLPYLEKIQEVVPSRRDEAHFR